MFVCSVQNDHLARLDAVIPSRSFEQSEREGNFTHNKENETSMRKHRREKIKFD